MKKTPPSEGVLHLQIGSIVLYSPENAFGGDQGLGASRSTVADLASGSVWSVPSISERRRDLVEIVLGYTAILVVIWTPNPLQRILYLVACALIVTIVALRRPNLESLGLDGRNLWASLWVIGAALLLGAISIFIAGRLHTLHPLHGQAPIFSHIWGYLVWSVMQQFLLQGFFLSRLLRITTPGKAVAIAAGLFAVAHIPSLLLAVATLVWGTCACLLYLKYRNLYVLGVAHGILGICFAVTVPDHFHHHMRVGIGYLNYHPHTGHNGHN
ncbi:MAG: CPBP family intramembrane metalloprotease [Silvibacterium sp.]|nr:CPBP family intramembrane metalloprotease [Silvibacterium sp.]